jgi:hypothetical protein
MKTTAIRKPAFAILAVLAVALLTVGMPATASATLLLLSDSFSLDGSTRVDGGTIGGLPVEFSSAATPTLWESSYGADPTFQAPGEISWTYPGSGPTNFRLNADLSSEQLSGSHPIVLSADLTPGDTTWTALGFTDGTTNPFWGTDPPNNDQAGQIWLTFDGDARNPGRFVFFADGTTHGSSGGIGTIDPFASHHIEIRYEPATSLAMLSIDGTLRRTLDLGALGFTPNIGGAGIMTLFKSGESGFAAADNFLVTRVPEPSTAALALLALFGVTACRQRRRR